MMEALPANWDGHLIMVDHMAGFVSRYLVRQIMAVLLKLLCVKVHAYISIDYDASQSTQIPNARIFGKQKRVVGVVRTGSTRPV